MSRHFQSYLSRSLRSRPAHVLVRAQSTWSPRNAIPGFIRSKLPGYLKDLAYENRMKEMSAVRKEDVEARKKQKQVDKSWGGEDPEVVLQLDVDRLLKEAPQIRSDGENVENIVNSKLPAQFSEIEVTVSSVSSTGDGLALSEDGNHVYVVPFTVPGDKAVVKIVRHNEKKHFTITDLIKVVEKGPQRDDSQIKCQYFGQCSGCQLQMLSYEDQLKHKKRIVEKAFANFSDLIPELIPAVDDTFPSPLQYGYRTKLTPHFILFGGRKRKQPTKPLQKAEIPAIGFNIKNRRMAMDIEDCPLGTDVVRKGLKRERKHVLDNIGQYSMGATILLRESTRRLKKDELGETNSETDDTVIRIEHPDYVEEKQCITDQNGYAVEYIDDYYLGNKAGSFFQNNNSILSGFTEYIRQQIHPKTLKEGDKPIKYLIDAYSGCGLFTVTLSKQFKSSLGIDIDANSIMSARDNAKKNELPNTGFAAADASLLFNRVPYPADETFLVIDPPRKGCSEDFLRQLIDYGPRRIAYVSCNVHTQARDVGYLVRGVSNSDIRYEIESIRGFDFFPQTGHVEGLAILNRVQEPKAQ